MASTTRLLPAEVYKSGKKLWESPIYVQDDKKTSEWNTRHAYLAQYGNRVCLLLYITKPPHGKVKECWTMHRLAEGLAPWGFSKAEESYPENDENLCIGVQTKEPEGLKFIALSKASEVIEFIQRVNGALGRDFRQTNPRLSRAATVPLIKNKPPGMIRSNTALPRIGRIQLKPNLDLSSLQHMREGSSGASSDVDSPFYIDPQYHGGQDMGDEVYEDVYP